MTSLTGIDYIKANEVVLKKFCKKEFRKLGHESFPVGYCSGMKTTAETKNIRKTHIDKINEDLVPCDKVQLISIYPMLGSRQCHNNCFAMIKALNHKTKRYTHILGYNTTACPCGKSSSVELHSVLRCDATGKYIDLTEDMFGETEKYFVPMMENPTLKNIQTIVFFRGDNAFLQGAEKRHECGGLTWVRNNPEYPSGVDAYKQAKHILTMALNVVVIY